MSRPPRPVRGIPLRAILPNAITALALCFGLTAVRFALSQDWEAAVLMVVIAGALDGIDGHIARLVRAESRFGAELDSLSDAISFGVAPALVLYLWSLSALPRFGWLLALVYAVFCALRLARFNAQIDLDHQPHKSAGFLTGVPAPAGAVLALAPVYTRLWWDAHWLREPLVVAVWIGFAAVLMISSIATFSASSLRLRQRFRFEAVAVLVVLGAAIVSAPWQTLSVVALLYLATIPFSVTNYRRIRRLREAGAGPIPAAEPSDRAP